MRLRYFAIFLVVLTVLRIIWANLQGVSPTEAYELLCASRMAPAFFDGPAGTALLIKLLGGSLFLTHIFWPVLAMGTCILAWFFAKSLYGTPVAGWTVILLNVLPAFNIFAVTAGPEIPALAFVLCGLIMTRLAMVNGRWIYWAGAGAAFSLAAEFEYAAVLVPVGLLIQSLASSRHRTLSELIGQATVWILLGVTLSGPLAWNASLEWVPIAGGTFRTAWAFHVWEAGRQVFEFLKAFSLPMAVLVPAGLWMLTRGAKDHARCQFLLASVGAVWLWWLYGTLRGLPSTAVGLLGTVPILIILSSVFRQRRWSSAMMTFAILIALISSAITLWMEAFERKVWSGLATEFQASIREIPAGEKESFFIAESPGLAAVLGHYLSSTQTSAAPAVFTPEAPDLPNQFALWPSYASFVATDKVKDEYFTEQKGENPYLGRTALYMGQDLPQTIKSAFSSVTAIKKIRVAGDRTFTIYLCRDYQTLPL